MLNDSYKLDCAQVLKHFGTDASKGLSDEKVLEQRDKFGLNGKFNLLRIRF